MKPLQTAADIMTRVQVSIRASEGVGDALALMERQGIRYLPVVSAEGLAVGLLRDECVRRALRWGFAERSVTECMSWPAFIVEERASLRELAQGMMQEKVQALLVTDAAGAVVGVVGVEDLLPLLVELLPARAEPGLTLRTLPYAPLVDEALREMSSAGL